MGRNLVRGVTVFAGSIVAALVSVSVALASGASSSKSAYSNPGGVVVQKVAGHEQTTKHVTHVTGTLPFTGVNLALFVGVGLLLVVLGVALRRMSRGA
jgi:hypothetical protein